MYKDYFYFDIETTSKYPTLFDLKLDDQRGFDLFIRKCEKLKKYPTSEWLDKPCEELYIEKSPLLPEFGKIICMSFGMFNNDQKHIMTIVDDDEKKLMERISKVINRALVSKKKLCGFNIKGFDIPWITRKLYKYEINVPRNLDFAGLKPWEIQVTDIQEIWKSTSKYNSTLDEIAYDLNIDSPKKIMNGENVHDYYWFKKDIKSIIDYCEGDVDCMIRVTEKLNNIRVI